MFSARAITRRGIFAGFITAVICPVEQETTGQRIRGNQ